MRGNISKGRLGEQKAVNYLIAKGYRIIDTNYRTKMGEIDIIATIHDILIFIEVKSRTNIDYGYPYEAVDWRKQNKIIKVSYAYIKQKGFYDYQIRYDIIEVYFGKKPVIRHIENAFC